MLPNSEKDFIKRHIGPSKEDQKKMLKELNYQSLDDLIDSTVPEKIKFSGELNIGESNSEYEALRKLRVGIKPETRVIARESTKIFDEKDNEIGKVTSGTFGPSVNASIAMGYISNSHSKADTKVFLEVRGKKHPANICSLPFYKKSYVKGVN